MAKLIGLIVDEKVDLNPLAWGIYFLSGQTKYYYASFDYIFDVPTDPAESAVSNFETEIDGVSDLKEFEHNIKSFKDIGSHEDPGNIRIVCARILRAASNKQVIDAMFQQCDYVAVVTGYSKPTLTNLKDHQYNTDFDDFLNTYFSESKAGWENVDSAWDRREYVALNFNPYDVVPVDYLDLTLPHFFINKDELVFNATTVIKEFIQYIGEDVDIDRIPKWEEVYSRWQSVYVDRYVWEQNFDVIVDYIVKGNYMDLTRFNVDPIREAAILNALIYKHNLTIKGYGLETLPKNTKDIHALLEPNFHVLTNVDVH